jgi:GT2 family glycosyltransferase
MMNTTTSRQALVKPLGAIELSMIFVNWNSLDYLSDSLRSIYRTALTVPFEIIVVDNASTCDPTETLKATFPDVIVLLNESNLGFARANNRGFQLASGKYLLFLNPDTEVIGSAIAVMLSRLQFLDNAGIVGCRLLNSDGSVQTSCIQRFPTILNQLVEFESLRILKPAWRLWGIDPLFHDNAHPVEVEAISGACLMISHETFEAAGQFSDEYFMYAEDIDLCYNVHRIGRKVFYTSGATVIHHGGGASKWQTSRRWTTIMQREAIMTFCRKVHGPLYSEAYRCAMAFNAVCRLILLTSLLPFRRLAERRLLYPSFSKWLGVLGWALRLQHVVINTPQ